MGKVQDFIQYGSAPYYCNLRLPDWVWDYDQVTIHDPNLGDTFILAFNKVTKSHSNNILYGELCTTTAVGVISYPSGSGWSEPVSGSHWIWTNSPYVDGSTGPCWTSKDIYGWNTSGKEWVDQGATEPKELVIESGWTDYGPDEELLDLTGRTLDILQGMSVAGVFRCKVNASNAENFRFEWYENGNLVSTQQNNRTYSDYRPSSAKTGENNCYCMVTALDAEGNPLKISVYANLSWRNANLALTTDYFRWKVVPYDYNIPAVESRVTGIALTVSPDTTVPGGHSFINVSVTGTGSYNPDFTAQISNHASPNTLLVTGDYGGNVWIGEDETADYVLVTVASVQDPTITATEMIYIDHSGTVPDPGSTEEQIQLAYWKGFAAAKAMYGGVK